MVDMTQANMVLWRPGQERHISISHLLRAFSRTDPAPNPSMAHQHHHPPRAHVNGSTQKVLRGTMVRYLSTSCHGLLLPPATW